MFTAMRKVLHRFRVPIMLGGSVGLFWVMAYFIPYIQLRQLVNYFVIIISTFIMGIVGPLALRDVLENNLSRSSQMIYGTFLVSLGVCTTFFWNSVRHLIDLPWMRENHLFPFFIWIISVGGLFYILAPNAYDTPIPTRNLAIFILMFMLAAIITVGLIRARYILYI